MGRSASASGQLQIALPIAWVRVSEFLSVNSSEELFGVRGCVRDIRYMVRGRTAAARISEATPKSEHIPTPPPGGVRSSSYSIGTPEQAGTLEQADRVIPRELTTLRGPECGTPGAPRFARGVAPREPRLASARGHGAASRGILQCSSSLHTLCSTCTRCAHPRSPRADFARASRRGQGVASLSLR